MARRPKRVLGRIDKIDLPEFDVENINAKMDTGAYRSSLHCKNIKLVDDQLKFKVKTDTGYKQFSTQQWERKRIKSSIGKIEERYVIKTQLRIFGKTYKVSFSLSDRSKMKNQVLIGRKFLKGKFIVDVSEKFLSFNGKPS